jgi:hypothetical protein
MAYDQKYLYHGEWLNVREMIERSGKKISYASVSRRLKNGWDAELAVEIPQLKARSSKSVPACGARSFYDCFRCLFPDCIIDHCVNFNDDPTSHDPYFTLWRMKQEDYEN